MDIKAILPELRATIETQRNELIETAKTIWANPEIAFKEVKASALLVGLLKKYGFKVECPYAGMDTAFRAEFTRGQGGATFALAAEYDALVGIGHACGHNTSGVASVAAALAAKTYMEKHDIPGTVVVLGTPGEEGGGGKVLMLKNADCLKGVDAVMMAHAIGGRRPNAMRAAPGSAASKWSSTGGRPTRRAAPKRGSTPSTRRYCSSTRWGSTASR